MKTRFGFEPEVIATIAKSPCRICEVGVSYYGRTCADRKKDNCKDGALYCIIKQRLSMTMIWPRENVDVRLHQLLEHSAEPGFGIPQSGT